MGRLNLTSEVTPSLTAQAAYNYRAPMKIERGEFGAQQMMFFAFGGRSRGTRVSRPCTWDGAVVQVTERDPRSRMVFLG